MAVYVTDDPAQNGLEDATIVIPTGNMVLTVIVTVLEMAGFPVGHCTFEVKVQVIASPVKGT